MKTLVFCKKIWFSNAKSRTRDAVTKFEQIGTKNTLQYLKTSQTAKLFGIFFKKLSLGVRSPWLDERATYATGFHYFLNKLEKLII